MFLAILRRSLAVHEMFYTNEIFFLCCYADIDIHNYFELFTYFFLLTHLAFGTVSYKRENV